MEESDIISSELVLFEKTPSYDNIIENIYVGNYASALDKALLKQLGITHILVGGNNLKALFIEDFVYKIIPLYDSEYTKIIKYFEETNEFIEEGNQKGKILVHCGAGISRSVSLVIAYMICRMKYEYSKAIQIMKTQRSVAKPNSGFEEQLRNYSYDLLQKF